MGEINTINFKYKITFIIPIYNTEKYLQRCVDSILEQTYNNIEIILVNDGSTDNSKQICEHYQQLDSRIKLINKPNGGLSDARNKGLDHSTGEYIIFIDSDDFWVDKYQLEKLLNAVSNIHLYDFVGFNCSYYYASKNKYKKWREFSKKNVNSNDKDEIIQELVKSGVFPMSACLKIINRNFLISNNIRFEKGLFSEDTPWFLEVLEKANKIHFINLYIYAYRQNVQGSITNSFSEKKYNDLLYIIKKSINNISNAHYSPQTKKHLMSFIAYLYCILLAQTYYFNKEDRTLKIKELYNFKYLLQYQDHPKVALVNFIYRIIGFKGTTYLLKTYLKHH